MKPIIVFALGALGVSAVCFAVRAAIPHEDADVASSVLDILDYGGKPKCRGDRDDRQITTRDFAWEDADSVTISVPATIHYRRGKEERVTVRARAWVLNHVNVGDGRIGLDCRNLQNAGPIEIVLPGVAMRSFVLSGAGKLYLEDIQQPDLDIDVSGANKIEASGHADNASLSIAGAGDVDMGRLTVGRLNVKIAGFGDVAVAPQDSADIHIAGSGRVRLVTEPKALSTHIAGAGRILHGPR